jgi:hypothetical protein
LWAKKRGECGLELGLLGKRKVKYEGNAEEEEADPGNG